MISHDNTELVWVTGDDIYKKIKNHRCNNYFIQYFVGKISKIIGILYGPLSTTFWKFQP
jgi:tetrahydromethanopterin S-methyltransferase subunit G